MDAGAGDIEGDGICRNGFIGLESHHVRVDVGVIVRGNDGLAEGHQSIDSDGVSRAGDTYGCQQAGAVPIVPARAARCGGEVAGGKVLSVSRGLSPRPWGQHFSPRAYDQPARLTHEFGQHPERGGWIGSFLPRRGVMEATRLTARGGSFGTRKQRAGLLPGRSQEVLPA